MAEADTTKELSTEELLKQLDLAKREVQEFKAKVVAANKKKEAAFKKKQEMSKSVGDRISGLLGNKDERNTITKEVRELKKQRDTLNQQIKERVAKLKEMTGGKEIPRFDRKNNPLGLKKQIEEMEYKLETQPMGFDAEQKLTKKIKELKKQYAAVKDQVETVGKVQEESRAIDKLKREANKYHRQVQDLAKSSQVKHESLMEHSKEIDELKKQEDETYQAFLEEKKKYIAINQELKAKVAALQKIKEELSKQNVKLKEDQKEEELKSLKERKEEAEQKVKEKKKLTTEDLLALQSTK